MKAVLVVGDGMGDRPIHSMDGKTPLEAARTPTLDKLSKEGITGLLHIIAPGIPPGSDTGHLALFGYDPWNCYSGRGPFEALGAGLKIQPSDVAFRGNFATVQRLKDKSFKVLDRRAGRSVPEGDALAALIDGISIPGAPNAKVIVGHTVEHRCAIVLRGPKLSSKISDTDPHGHSDRVLKSEPLHESSDAKRTANIVNKLTTEFHRILSASPLNAKRQKAGLPEANMILLRGAGTLPEIPSLTDIYGIKAACVAGGALYKGVASSVGMKVLDVPGATGSFDTDVVAKAKAAAKALKTNDLVFVHLKAIDSAAHDKNCSKKIAMIEKLDHLLATLLENIDKSKTYIAITADHTTTCSSGNHSGDPVPLLIAGPEVHTDKVTTFGEHTCATGGLGHLKGIDLMPLLMNYLNRTPMFGA
ncbi:MAG: 2,3-bisphosphoglycerate-independent phosphoglycerate mutase [Promethearchaeota archaeon]